MTDRKMEDVFIEQVYGNMGIIKKTVFLYADNQQDRADLEQEILLNLWKSFSSFKGESKFQTWMYRIALNTAIFSFKKKKKQYLFFQRVKNEMIEIPWCEENTQSDIDKLKILKAHIADLNDMEKAILHLYLENHSYRDISLITGLSEKNINVKMFRLKEKLKKKIKISLKEESCPTMNY